MAETWMEFAKRILPDQSEDVLEFLLWNHTPFPFSKPEDVESHLRNWDRRRRGGWSECIMCDKPYRHKGSVLLGGECGGDHCIWYEEVIRPEIEERKRDRSMRDDLEG